MDQSIPGDDVLLLYGEHDWQQWFHYTRVRIAFGKAEHKGVYHAVHWMDLLTVCLLPVTRLSMHTAAKKSSMIVDL